MEPKSEYKDRKRIYSHWNVRWRKKECSLEKRQKKSIIKGVGNGEASEKKELRKWTENVRLEMKTKTERHTLEWEEKKTEEKETGWKGKEICVTDGTDGEN